MNSEQERAAFEDCFKSLVVGPYQPHNNMYVADEIQARLEAWQARAALQSQDREDAATEATGGDENGGHRLVEPDHETALALADAPRSLRNYVAALRSAIALQSQEYTAAIGEAGQAYLDRFKHAHALPAEFRWSELWAVMCVAANKGRTDATQSQDREDAERYRWLRRHWFTMTSSYRGDRVHFTINQPRYSNATERDVDEAIDHARRIEGDGE